LPVEINTNGTLLADWADFLVTQGVGVISVSIDGTEEVHDQIRGQKGLFSRSVEGITSLLEARRGLNSPGPLIQIACTISKANLGVLESMVPLAADIGVDIMLFQHTGFNTPANIEVHNRLLRPEKAARYGLEIFQPSIPEGEFYENEIGPEDIPLLTNTLRRAKGQANGRVNVRVSPNVRLDDIGPYYLDMKYPSSQKCIGLWTTLRVLSDGTFSPCLHVAAGNITEQSIMEIWNSPSMRSLRKLISRKLFPGCARCCHRRF
jgi:MoaA/NifB/PqqE/SkfB family radical SAM enzyme